MRPSRPTKLLLIALAAATLAGCKQQQPPLTPPPAPAPTPAPSAAVIPEGDVRPKTVDLSLTLLHLDERSIDDEGLKAVASFAFPGLSITSDANRAAPSVQVTRGPPDPEVLKKLGEGRIRGLDGPVDLDLKKIQSLTRLSFRLDPHKLTQLKSAEVMALAATKRTGEVLVYDETADEAFTPEAFGFRRVDSWAGDDPEVQFHYITHLWREHDGTVTLETTGMRTFGFPELQLPGSTSSASANTSNRIFSVLTQRLVEQGRVGTSGRIDVAISEVQHPQAKDTFNHFVGELDDKSPHRVSAFFRTVPGILDDSTDEWTVDFAPALGSDVSQRQRAAADALFGAIFDETRKERHDAELLALSARQVKYAKEILKPQFQQRSADIKVLDVKAPFKTAHGGNEWMWVEVTRWDGKTIEGLLDNEPEDVPSLKPGSKVTVSEDEIFDYSLQRPDGGYEGNETGKLLLKRQSKAQKAE